MATRPLQPNHAVELALLAILATLWASSYTFIKIGIDTIPPITLIAARTLIAGGILVLIMRWRGIRLPRDAASWRNFAVQACLNSVIPFTLIAWAEKSIDAGLAVILNSMTPVFTFLITWLWSRHEATSLRKFAGVVLGLAGTCIIVGSQAFTHVGHELAAQLAVGSLLSGAMILLPLSLIVDRPWTLAPSEASILALVGLAVFSTAMAFVIYFRLIHTLGSVGTTAQAYLRAPIGIAIGAYFLGESLSGAAWFGLLFILAGVAAMTIPQGKRKAVIQAA
jgi:drug/metabolite transporter (DMT)-like permease